MEALLGRCEAMLGSGAKRAALLGDGELLAGLGLMADGDRATSESALRLLAQLAEAADPAASAQLRSLLRPVLLSLRRRHDLSPAQTAHLATLSQRLHLQPEQDKPLRSLQTSTEGQAVGAGPAKMRKTQPSGPARSFLGAQRSRPLLFRSRQPLSAALRGQMEPLVAKVKGVLSIYVDLEAGEMTVRVRTAVFSLEALREALGPLGGELALDQVLPPKQPGGERPLEPFVLEAPVPEDDEKENRDPLLEDGPEYLSESYDASPKAGDKALARTAQPQGSNGGSRWLSNVTSFLSENLFW